MTTDAYGMRWSRPLQKWETMLTEQSNIAIYSTNTILTRYRQYTRQYTIYSYSVEIVDIIAIDNKLKMGINGNSFFDD